MITCSQLFLCSFFQFLLAAIGNFSVALSGFRDTRPKRRLLSANDPLSTDGNVTSFKNFYKKEGSAKTAGSLLKPAGI